MKKILTLLVALLGISSMSAQTLIRNGQTLTISILGVPVSEKGRLDATYSVSSTGHIEMWMIGKANTVMYHICMHFTLANKFQWKKHLTWPRLQK